MFPVRSGLSPLPITSIATNLSLLSYYPRPLYPYDLRYYYYAYRESVTLLLPSLLLYYYYYIRLILSAYRYLISP